MANTENYSVQQYETLCSAIAQGVLEVEYADKKVTYRSLNEMLRIKALMETQLFPNKKRTARKFFTFKKGFN